MQTINCYFHEINYGIRQIRQKYCHIERTSSFASPFTAIIVIERWKPEFLLFLENIRTAYAMEMLVTCLMLILDGSLIDTAAMV